MFIFAYTVTAHAGKEFSINLDMLFLSPDLNQLDDILIENGFDRPVSSTGGFGLTALWRYNDNIFIELSADMCNDWVSKTSYDMDIFKRFTFLGLVYHGNRFPLNVFEPGLAIGFGSLQLRSPVESYLTPHPPYHIELPSIDPFLEHPTVESKLSKRFGLLDAGVGMSLPILLKKGAKMYDHLLVLRLKTGYIFTFADSDWRMGPVRVSDGPEVSMNSFYFRFQLGYGGSW
jgi:hypothetical protein